MASHRSRSNNKLNRTLKELETAFADWESLGTRRIRTAEESAAERNKAKAADEAAKEFQRKTQVLLDQLCQQLEELKD